MGFFQLLLAAADLPEPLVARLIRKLERLGFPA